MITKIHRRLIRAMARIYRDSCNRECDLITLAGRVHLAAERVHRLCLELRDLGVFVYDGQSEIVKLDRDMLLSALEA